MNLISWIIVGLFVAVIILDFIIMAKYAHAEVRGVVDSEETWDSKIAEKIHYRILAPMFLVLLIGIIVVLAT